jgi:hypothetical protein
MKTNQQIKEYIMKRITIKDGGCWEANLAPNGKGYVVVNINSRTWRLHRLSYTTYKGDIEGKILDHLCRNRKCVNPEHLEIVTNQVNVQRGFDARGSKKFCKRGHEYTPENTIVYKGDGRNKECRTCRKLRSKK